jgi:hypothetical protein
VSAPTLVVPIDFTSEDTTGANSRYTYQSVSVPSGFYLGNNYASVYWTQSLNGVTNITISSFSLGYAGVETVLKLGYFSSADQVNGYWSPLQSSILHTKGLVNVSDAASWTQDGYYYWNQSEDERITSSSVTNAINPIGDGMPITYIGSEWVDSVAYPIISITKTYINSYTYTY